VPVRVFLSNILMITTFLSKHFTVKKLVQTNQCKLFALINRLRARGDAGTALQAGKSQFRFPMVSLQFSINISFRPHYGSAVDSASNRNEYQEHFLGVKAVGA